MSGSTISIRRPMSSTCTSVGYGKRSTSDLLRPCSTQSAGSAIAWEWMLRLPRSTSVRLALGYAALLAASSLLLVGFLWWRTAVLLARRNDADISAASQQMTEQLRDFGTRGAVAAVEERASAAADPRKILLLADGELKPMAGNLTRSEEHTSELQSHSFI